VTSHPKVLLIGWDAADWKVIHPLMDAGQMPNVRGLVDRGSMAQLATLRPPLSPMLWTSIATGKRPFKHGIHGFSEPTPDGRGVQPVTILSRKSKAVWNILSQNGLRSVVVGWWPSHPAEPIQGVIVSDFFHRAPRRQADA
jgi:predicted AlkP superfamily phosphohydrolase/phosphomutase